MRSALTIILILALSSLTLAKESDTVFVEYDDPETFNDFIWGHNRTIIVIYDKESYKLKSVTKMVDDNIDSILETEPNMKFIKVHPNVFPIGMQEIRTTKYPALLLHEQGRQFFYNGVFEAKPFLKWLSNVCRRQITILSNQRDFDEFVKADSNSKVVALYKKEMVEARQILQNLVDLHFFADAQIFHIGLCLDTCNFEYGGAKLKVPTLAVINPKSQQHLAVFNAKYDDFESLKAFIFLESMADVTTIDTSSLYQFFAGYAKFQLVLILEPGGGPKATYNKEILSMFEANAYVNRRDDLFSDRFVHGVLYWDEGWERIKDFFNLFGNEKFPLVFATSLNDNQMVKFRMNYDNGPFSPQSLRQFLEDAKNKALQADLKSEVRMPNDNSLVEKIVGKSFREQVISSPSSYVVFFYDDLNEPGNMFTKKIIDYVAYKAKEKFTLKKDETGVFKNIRNVLVGEMDITKNEVLEYTPTGAPEIAIWPRGGKGKPETFNLPLTVKSLIAWINSIAPEAEIEFSFEEEKEFQASSLSENERKMYAKTENEFGDATELFIQLEEKRKEQEKKRKEERQKPDYEL